MYCPSCAVAVAEGLSYCNFCGAKLTLSVGGAESSEVKPGTLIAAMAFVFIFGLAAIGFLVVILKAVFELNVGPILAFTSLSFLILLVLEGIFIRLLFQRSRTKQAPDTGQFKGPASKELHAAPARESAEPLPSVTEHTTRPFDPVYRERASK